MFVKCCYYFELIFDSALIITLLICHVFIYSSFLTKALNIAPKMSSSIKILSLPTAVNSPVVG